jgi:hypothetical protein
MSIEKPILVAITIMFLIEVFFLCDLFCGWGFWVVSGRYQ